MTDRARRVMVLAQEEARITESSSITTLHLLLGLIHEGEGVAAIALRELRYSLEALRDTVPPEEPAVLPRSSPTPERGFTPRAKKVLELSLREALTLGHNYIGTEHILLGIVREGEGSAAKALESKLPLSEVRRKVIDLLRGYDEAGRSTTTTSSDDVDETVGQWNKLRSRAQHLTIDRLALDVTVESVEAWLESRPYTLFADWHIDSAGQRRKAAEWFVEQLESMRSESAQPDSPAADLGNLSKDQLKLLRQVAELAQTVLRIAGLSG